LILIQPNQMKPFSPIVPANAPIAIGGRAIASWGPFDMSFSADSLRICTNEIIIIIENTNIPSGSSLRRPTGNFFLSLCKCHSTNLCVVNTIAVHSKSNAESASDAMSESEDEYPAAIPFAMRRRTLAITLILIAHFAFLLPTRRFSCSSSGRKGSTRPSVSCNAPPPSAIPSPLSSRGSKDSRISSERALTMALTSSQSSRRSFWFS
jgi:hypothetical protein